MDPKGFNTGLKGSWEYMQKYFLGACWPDAGWAEFGQDVEDYICYRDYSEVLIDAIDLERKERGDKTLKEIFNCFTDEEKNTLQKVEPLGLFQEEIKIWIFDNVYVKGFIDDATKGLSKLRDYKTASERSKQRYYKPEYKQLNIYGLYGYEKTGIIPELEVCIIERKGNCFGMENRRDLLSVGDRIWYLPIETNLESLLSTKSYMKKVVEDISEMYKLFLKMK